MYVYIWISINQHFLHIKIFRRKSNCNMVLEIFCNLFDWILWIHKVHHVYCACVGWCSKKMGWAGGRVKMTFKVCGRKTTPFTPNQDFFADWTNPTQQIHFREASKDILLHSHVEMYFAIITVSVPRVHFLKRF